MKRMALPTPGHQEKAGLISQLQQLTWPTEFETGDSVKRAHNQTTT